MITESYLATVILTAQVHTIERKGYPLSRSSENAAPSTWHFTSSSNSFIVTGKYNILTQWHTVAILLPHHSFLWSIDSYEHLYHGSYHTEFVYFYL